MNFPQRRLYLGTRSGVVALDLEGARWTRGEVLWRDRPISALAVDPANPDRIHASVYEDGVYRSEDRGRTWERYLWGELHALIVQPKAPDVLLAAGETALVYRSVDRGGYWTASRVVEPQVAQGPPNERGRVRCLAFDPADQDVAYAGLEGGGVLATFDGGHEWSPLAAQGLPAGVQALIVRSQAPDQIVAGTAEGLYRSVDRGFFWTHAGAGMEDPNILALAEDSGTLLAAAHPSPLGDWWDASSGARIYRLPTGAARWWPATERLDGAVYGFANEQSMVLYAGTTGGTVLRSDDEGTSWKVLATGLPPIRAIAI